MGVVENDCADHTLLPSVFRRALQEGQVGVPASCRQRRTLGMLRTPNAGLRRNSSPVRLHVVR